MKFKRELEYYLLAYKIRCAHEGELVLTILNKIRRSRHRKRKTSKTTEPT